MSAAEVVFIAVVAFFLVGVMVGIAVVYALSARKADTAHHRNRPDQAGEGNHRPSPANASPLRSARKAGKDQTP